MLPEWERSATVGLHFLKRSPFFSDTIKREIGMFGIINMLQRRKYRKALNAYFVDLRLHPSIMSAEAKERLLELAITLCRETVLHRKEAGRRMMHNWTEYGIDPVMQNLHSFVSRCALFHYGTGKCRVLFGDKWVDAYKGWIDLLKGTGEDGHPMFGGGGFERCYAIAESQGIVCEEVLAVVRDKRKSQNNTAPSPSINSDPIPASDSITMSVTSSDRLAEEDAPLKGHQPAPVQERPESPSASPPGGVRSSAMLTRLRLASLTPKQRLEAMAEGQATGSQETKDEGESTNTAQRETPSSPELREDPFDNPPDASRSKQPKETLADRLNKLHGGEEGRKRFYEEQRRKAKEALRDPSSYQYWKPTIGSVIATYMHRSGGMCVLHPRCEHLGTNTLFEVDERYTINLQYSDERRYSKDYLPRFLASCTEITAEEVFALAPKLAEHISRRSY